MMNKNSAVRYSFLIANGIKHHDIKKKKSLSYLWQPHFEVC